MANRSEIGLPQEAPHSLPATGERRQGLGALFNRKPAELSTPSINTQAVTPEVTGEMPLVEVSFVPAAPRRIGRREAIQTGAAAVAAGALIVAEPRLLRGGGTAFAEAPAPEPSDSPDAQEPPAGEGEEGPGPEVISAPALSIEAGAGFVHQENSFRGFGRFLSRDVTQWFGEMEGNPNKFEMHHKTGGMTTAAYPGQQKDFDAKVTVQIKGDDSNVDSVKKTLAGMAARVVSRDEMVRIGVNSEGKAVLQRVWKDASGTTRFTTLAPGVFDVGANETYTVRMMSKGNKLGASVTGSKGTFNFVLGDTRNLPRVNQEGAPQVSDTGQFALNFGSSPEVGEASAEFEGFSFDNTEGTPGVFGPLPPLMQK